jgi:glycosyltransferase involved in cell wall biosynthesis
MMDRARQGSTIERMPESTSPLATIAITTHDRPDLLRRAVDSALAQSVRDLEVIVVDDGSAEPVIMDRSDSRLRVLRNDRPLGVSAARNRGLWAARGHWVTFTDDDDELLPEMLQASLEAVQRSTLPPPVAVLSGLEVLDHGGRLLEVRQPTRIPRGTPPFRGAPDDGFSQDLNTLFAPVEILRSMGGWDDHIKGWEMDDLLIRLAEVMSLEGTPQVTYRRFRDQGPRKSNNADIALAGGELVLSKHLEFFRAHRQLHARHLATLSGTYLRAGRWWPAVRTMSCSVLADPRRQKAVQQWIGTLTGPRVYGSYLRARRRQSELRAPSSSRRRG